MGENPYSKLSQIGNMPDDEFNTYSGVNERAMRAHTAEVKQFDAFMTSDMVVQPGNKESNMCEQVHPFRQLKIPSTHINRWFKLYDICRKIKVPMSWGEKQDPVSSGLRLDFDILQSTANRQLTTRMAQAVAHRVLTEFVRIFEVVEVKTLVVADVRQCVTLKEEVKLYKDGFHLHFPGLHMSRAAKKYLIREILKGQYLSKIFGTTFGTDPEKFLDIASAWVPLVLFGSAKSGSHPYNMQWVWAAELDTLVTLTPDTWFQQSADHVNFALELSVNWDGVAIPSATYKPRVQFASEIEILSKPLGREQDEEREVQGDLNHLTINDPDCAHTKEILELLKPSRCDSRTEWFKVVYALVNEHVKFIPLARWWSRKSTGYTEEGFNKCVDDCLHGPRYSLKLSSVHHWASHDSPDKYSLLTETSCFDLLSQFVFDDIVEGRLGQAHFAAIVQPALCNKYVTELVGIKRTWYEFKFPQDKHEPGQVYKWVPVTTPDALDKYLHHKLHNLNLKMCGYLRTCMEKTEDQNTAKYYANLIKNFKSAARCLFTDAFKNGIMRQLERLYTFPGFSKVLDQNPFALGVAQGVMILDSKGGPTQIIRSFNALNISRFTNTEYKEFDPRDPLTRKLLKGFRSSHPDDQTDAFEYKMGMRAASIDARPREAIILLITGPGGNGKSFELELHQATLGEQYCASMPIAMILQNGREDNAEGAKPFLMKLETARCAYYEEGPACAILNMPVIKRITGCGILSGRQLFGEARNIKTRCYHFAISNHDFIVETHEEAVWRRLRYMVMPIMYKDDEMFDEKNPFHRRRDRSFDAAMQETPECKSAYLSIMVFFHRKLMSKYGGIIDNIPHPTIDAMTAKYRHSQDMLSAFLDQRIVNSTDCEDKVSVESVVEQYCIWHAANHGKGHLFKQSIKSVIIESGIKDIIDTTVFGSFLKPGYRCMLTGEHPRDGESLYARAQTTSTKKSGPPPFPVETPDQYLDRVEREWGEMQEGVVAPMFQEKDDDTVNPYLTLHDTQPIVDNHSERLKNIPIETEFSTLDEMMMYL